MNREERRLIVQHPIQQWERESEQSLREARRRRQERRAHPWPERGDWLWALLIAVCLIALGYAFLIGMAWVAAPAVML